MKVEDVKNCSFQKWYNNFKDVTIRSIILPLPDELIHYILKDGIVLPEGSNSSFIVDPNSSEDSDSETDWTNANADEAESPNFPDFDKLVENAIDDLGGKVFPKLNWSSPQDASWIALNTSLCCTSVSDIYLLLQSSDFIVHDLTKPFSDCDDYVQNENVTSSSSRPNEDFFLILRKWVEIDTSGEYRCFVKNNKLIGITQREISVYFDHIGADKNRIIEDILRFFKRHIQFKFPLSSYAFDVYRKKEKTVKLLDFNPFGYVTDPLLFSWEELNHPSEVHDGIPEFRYVDENAGVQPRPLSYHAIPRDIVDISTGEDSFKLVDLMKLKVEEEQRNGFSSDDDQECPAEK